MNFICYVPSLIVLNRYEALR